ncbi:MAG TPA: ABC transporter permease [Thermoanaerobaculia bacterium]|nr:ABC transporter permease [Thermoanaerobaculia bacterium]
MQIGESVRTSLEEVRAHPLRSFFTLIGVILGTTALVVVLSVMEGVKAAVWQGFEDLGYDGVLILSPKPPTDRTERAKAHFSKGLRAEDVPYFADNSLIGAVSPVGETQSVVVAGTVTRRVPVYGVTAEFAQIKNRRVGEGRWLSDHDIDGVVPVCVVGFKLKQQLFGGDKALGQLISLGGRRFTVIGVGTEFNTQFVNDDDMRKETRGIYIPFSVYANMVGERNAVSYVMAKAIDSEKAVEAEDEASRLMASAHHGIHDVGVNNIGKEILKERGKVVVLLQNWKIVFFSIAGISLLIGGVGIFSVLKISISERLFEIGLRKAMGATNAEIFVQFLIESVTLSVVGAAVGGSLGVLLVKAIATSFPAGLPVSLIGLTTATGFAVSIGLFAGAYPSLSASRLEPVDALRA